MTQVLREGCILEFSKYLATLHEMGLVNIYYVDNTGPNQNQVTVRYIECAKLSIMHAIDVHSATDKKVKLLLVNNEFQHKMACLVFTF